MPHTRSNPAPTRTNDAISAVAAGSPDLQIRVPLAASAPEGKSEPTGIDRGLPILPGDIERALLALANFEVTLRNQDAEEKAADDEGGMYNVNWLVWGRSDVQAVPAWVDPNPLLTQPGYSGFSLFQAFHQTFTIQRFLEMVFGTSPEARAVYAAALNHILACAAMSRMSQDDERITDIDYQAYEDVCAAMAKWMKANRAH